VDRVVYQAVSHMTKYSTLFNGLFSPSGQDDSVTLVCAMDANKRLLCWLELDAAGLVDALVSSCLTTRHAVTGRRQHKIHAAALAGLRLAERLSDRTVGSISRAWAGHGNRLAVETPLETQVGHSGSVVLLRSMPLKERTGALIG
jgi:hypothetical protein